MWCWFTVNCALSVSKLNETVGYLTVLFVGNFKLSSFWKDNPLLWHSLEVLGPTLRTPVLDLTEKCVKTFILQLKAAHSADRHLKHLILCFIVYVAGKCARRYRGHFRHASFFLIIISMGPPPQPSLLPSITITHRHNPTRMLVQCEISKQLLLHFYNA